MWNKYQIIYRQLGNAIYIIKCIYIYIYIYIYSFYLKKVTSKRLPLQPVSSERNHQVADKFRKMSRSNVYGRKGERACGHVGVKQCMHSFHSLDCLSGVSFYDYMSKLFPIFYLANFVCFYPS